jgi:hypothetical protein
MSKKLLIVSALATLPVFGAEVGLLIDKQVGKAQAVALDASHKWDAVSPTGFGIRGAYEILDLKVAAIQMNATWHNKTTGDIAYNGTKLGELDNQYWAAGAMVNWKFLVNIGAGVEYRSEKLAWRANAAAPAGFTSGDNTQGRTWARVNVGFSIPTPLVSPFFALEVAAPLSKKDTTTTPTDVAQAMAPQVQFGIYGGIRF